MQNTKCSSYTNNHCSRNVTQNLGLILYADDTLLLLLLYVRVENCVKFMRFCQIRLNLTCGEDLCKLGKEYLF